jgi:hypothetical protein
MKWNGGLLWSPASKNTDIVIRFGDEVRSVFGPIPPFDVTTLGKRTTSSGWTIETGLLRVEVDGNVVELKPNTSKMGSPLEFEHRDAKDNFVKWTKIVEKCDKPSLAGGVTPCGTSSRISRAVKGNIEWLALARKTYGVVKLDPDPYWQAENPNYALLGYIGFNRVTGELAFFDGSYAGMKFNWKTANVPPGGTGYNDEPGRALSALTYDATFRIDCAACHDNKEPRIITPYIKQKRVGYRDDDLAEKNSLQALLPYIPRPTTAPYRVVGSGYTATHAKTLRDARTIADPTGNCVGCHGLTNLGTGRFASDAVGKLGTLTGDAGVENQYRTDWTLRTGSGKIHPWMVPLSGNDLSGDPPPAMMGDSDWLSLKTVIESPDSDPATLKLYTEAPAPESVKTDATRIADPYAPSGFAFSVVDNKDGATEKLPKQIDFSWKYYNGLGGVPERDDVRFNVAIKEVEIPGSGGTSPTADFPSISQAKGEGATPLLSEVFRVNNVLVIKDISFLGHKKYSDPSPTTVARSYEISFPAARKKRYLIRLLPKRFCFDQSTIKYGDVDHIFSIDVN